MANEMTGKVAIVTGGARGLGRGMVELFVEEGARVVIADILDEEGQALAGSLGDAVRFKHTDVSSREDMQALIDYALAEFGGLHAMVNNAGYPDDSYATLLDADFARFERVMAVNMMGVMLGTQIAARHMVQQGGGSIINIASIAGIQGGFGVFCYRAAKAGVINFTQTAAIELGPHLIRVNCICPGNIPTVMGGYATAAEGTDDDRAQRLKQAVLDVRMSWQPLKRQGSPRDIAEAALYLAGDRSHQVTAQILSVDGGATAGTVKSIIAEIQEARVRVERE